MKNRAAARIEKIIYGVSIGGLPLQVANTEQRKYFNTKLNGYQLKNGALKKRCFAPTFVSTAQRFSSSPTNLHSKLTFEVDDYGYKATKKDQSRV